MSVTITLTDDQADTLRDILGVLLRALPNGGKVSTHSLTSEDYESLYWSGRSARKLAADYGVNRNHFIRVWERMGLDTVVWPTKRPALKERMEARERKESQASPR